MLITVEPAYAIPPPDLVVNILTPALQLLGVVMALFVVTLYSVKDYLLTKAGIKIWMLIGAIGLVLVGGVALVTLNPSPDTKEAWREEVIQEINEIEENLISDEDTKTLKEK